MQGAGTVLDRPAPVAPPRRDRIEFVPGLDLIRLLARGGFAEVWEAEQTSLGRRVAVKILRHEHLAQQEMVAFFEQEARVLARLNHPNLVHIIDRGATPAGPFFVMEYVEGKTLQEMLTAGDLSRDRAIWILVQASRGLAYAHRNKVIHRDIKPANILVSRTGQVKLSDFGIAAVRRAAEGLDLDTGPSPKTALGTRAFMAPEQRSAFDFVGPEADVYSLGVILHRIITGKLPPGPGLTLPGADIPDRIRPIIEKALAVNPTVRFSDAGAFREALINALEGRHIDDRVRRGAASSIDTPGGFELLDVIRQDDRRSVYLVRKGGPGGEKIVVKRYQKDNEALRVARAMMRVDHPNICKIHVVGERDEAFIMVMEHCDGGDLRERLVQPHPWREAVRVAREVAQGLAFAARDGIVHGNVRPSNVMFDRDGGIKVTDFGLPEHYTNEGSTQRNWYAAPEGGRSHAADLFSLGAVVYEMLFAAAPPESIEDAVANLRRRVDLPQGFVRILARLLAPVSTRYASAEEVARELSHLLQEDRRLQAECTGGTLSPAPRPAALARSAPRSPSYGPALLGLSGLILAWLLQQGFFQTVLEELFAHW